MLTGRATGRSSGNWCRSSPCCGIARRFAYSGHGWENATNTRRHGEHMKQQAGFTLVELMVTIAVLAILVGIAMPSFRDTMRSNRLVSATNDLTSALALARTEAIRNTRGAGVCASTAGTACDGSDWSNGWMVWGDANGNGSFDATDPVLRYFQGKADTLRVTGPAASGLRFDRRGRLAATQSLSLQPRDCGSRPMKRSLTVSRTGQVRKGASLETCS
ncbi:GspH/FimT family pseudopilin [Luteimonas sp. e5]